MTPAQIKPPLLDESPAFGGKTVERAIYRACSLFPGAAGLL